MASKKKPQKKASKSSMVSAQSQQKTKWFWRRSFSSSDRSLFWYARKVSIDGCPFPVYQSSEGGFRSFLAVFKRNFPFAPKDSPRSSKSRVLVV